MICYWDTNKYNAKPNTLFVEDVVGITLCFKSDPFKTEFRICIEKPKMDRF